MWLVFLGFMFTKTNLGLHNKFFFFCYIKYEKRFIADLYRKEWHMAWHLLFWLKMKSFITFKFATIQRTRRNRPFVLVFLRRGLFIISAFAYSIWWILMASIKSNRDVTFLSKLSIVPPNERYIIAYIPKPNLITCCWEIFRRSNNFSFAVSV